MFIAPSNPIYRKAILKAIEDLHDCHLRSNVDAIRRHVMSSLETDEHNPWSEVLFMKTLKSVVQMGEVEQQTVANCALSPEYKRRRADSLTAVQNKARNEQIPFIPEAEPCPDKIHGHRRHSSLILPESPKQTPKRKIEHDKYRIIPKPIFDRIM